MGDRLTEWKCVGEIGVDAGLCWLGDPCYIFDDKGSEAEAPWKGWRGKDGFCEMLAKRELDGVAQWNYRAGHPGLGVTVNTGYGDGTYKVFARRNSEGRVMQVMVDFSQEMGEENEENEI